jgi:hypothetical protein
MCNAGPHRRHWSWRPGPSAGAGAVVDRVTDVLAPLVRPGHVCAQDEGRPIYMVTFLTKNVTQAAFGGAVGPGSLDE